MTTTPHDSPQEFDHSAPGTHEAEQEAQPELGAEKPAKVKRVAKKAKKAKAPKAKKAAKPKASKKAPKKAKSTTPGHIGKHAKTLADGRKAPGTNPAVNEQAAKYGRKLAKIRIAAELTQASLAEKSGLSQPGIANIERGVSGVPRYATQLALSKALKDKGLLISEPPV